MQPISEIVSPEKSRFRKLSKQSNIQRRDAEVIFFQIRVETSILKFDSSDFFLYYEMKFQARTCSVCAELPNICFCHTELETLQEGYIYLFVFSKCCWNVCTELCRYNIHNWKHLYSIQLFTYSIIQTFIHCNAVNLYILIQNYVLEHFIYYSWNTGIGRYQCGILPTKCAENYFCNIGLNFSVLPFSKQLFWTEKWFCCKSNSFHSIANCFVYCHRLS